jgi:hypothetical protein
MAVNWRKSKPTYKVPVQVTVTISRHRSPSRPPNELSGTELLKGALCQSDGRRGCTFDNELKGCQHQ